ncbi:MAG: LysR family transcriptional regulator [Planctomycetota bacterium]|nr:LysR family transcriptional regulator [Planctomycetota bacterium]
MRAHRNFTYAADELHVSQPAVSRQIRQLEEDVGVPLVEQVGKYVDLTPAGVVLAEEAERLLGDMDRTRERLQAFATPSAGGLRIGTSTTTGIYLLPKILHVFCRDYPDVEIDFKVENSRIIERGVLANEFDLGFVASPPEAPEIVAEALLQDEMTCFAAPHHPLAGEIRCTPKQLAEATWIMREEGSATRAQCDRFMSKLGIQPRRRIELTQPETIKELVATGLGISFLSTFMVEVELAEKRLAALRTPGARMERTLFLLTHRRKRVSPVHTAFRDTLDRFLSESSRRRKGA